MNNFISAISKYFKLRSIQSIAYAAVLLITIIISTIFFIWSLLFVGRLIDSLIIASDEESVPVSAFNLDDFKILAKKFKIAIPEKNQKIINPQPVNPKNNAVEIPSLITASTSAASTSNSALIASSSILKADVSMQILNGTIILGLAKIWQAKFVDGGFINIEVGNAKERNYEGAEIYYKISKKELLPAIRGILLSGDYKDKIISEKEGTADDKYDFIIILGK